MATRTRYWRLGASAGGDGTNNTDSGGNHAYQTLYALLAAEATDLVTAGDILHAITTVEGQESTSAEIELSTLGFTTGPSNYILIEAQGDAHTNGISYEKDSQGYQFKRAGDCITPEEGYVRFKGFEFCTTGGSYYAFRFAGNPSGSDVQLDEMLFTKAVAGGSVYAVDLSYTLNYTMNNCLIIAQGDRGIDLRGATGTMDHCGVVSSGAYGIMVDSNDTVTNTYALDTTTEDWYSEANASSSNNASVDGSAPNTNEVTITTPTDEFTNYTAVPSTADLTLKNTGVLYDGGSGGSSVDITGATRTGSAIGPFDYASSGSIIPQAKTYYDLLRRQ